jgi:hypothetical protein
MVKDLSYATISRVIESWDLARREPNFEDKVGTLALLRYVLMTRVYSHSTNTRR